MAVFDLKTPFIAEILQANCDLIAKSECIFAIFLNNFVTIFKKRLTFFLINGKITFVNCTVMYFSLLFGFQKQEEKEKSITKKEMQFPVCTGEVPLIKREKRRD